MSGQCCYLNQDDPSKGCETPAVWGISCAGDPYDISEACAAHVGALLQADRLNYVWLLVPDAALNWRCRDCGALVDVDLVVHWNDGGRALCVRCASEGGELG